jgi:heme O synthase-like polyprenyltransferase
MYREDYARGGFRMLTSVDHPGALTARLAFIYTVALLPITASLTMTGVSGSIFLVTSQVLGLGFVVLGWRFLRLRADLAAKRLFLASIIYLPVLLGLMVADMDDRISHVGGSMVSTIAATHPDPESTVDL